MLQNIIISLNSTEYLENFQEMMNETLFVETTRNSKFIKEVAQVVIDKILDQIFMVSQDGPGNTLLKVF